MTCAGGLEEPPSAKRASDQRKELSFAENEKPLGESGNQGYCKGSEEKATLKTKIEDSPDMSTRALPPLTKKCNWGILGFGNKSVGSKKSGSTNSNWAAPQTPKSPAATKKEITSEGKIASDKQPLTRRPPTPPAATSHPPKLPEKLKKQTGNQSREASEAVNLGGRQIATKPPIKTAKQERQASEETAKQTKSEQSSSLAIPPPTPPPRQRRSSGQR